MSKQADVSADLPRIRRVLELCCKFAVNLAYYRAGWERDNKELLDYSKNNFWRVVNGNFLDTCVLDWCKLFVDRNGKHHWTRVVGDHQAFKMGLLSMTEVNEEQWLKTLAEMREYRDKFVAHLDLEARGQYPALEIPKQSVLFCYSYLVDCGENEVNLAGLPSDFERGYEEEAGNAREVYRAIRSAG